MQNNHAKVTTLHVLVCKNAMKNKNSISDKMVTQQNGTMVSQNSTPVSHISALVSLNSL